MRRKQLDAETSATMHSHRVFIQNNKKAVNVDNRQFPFNPRLGSSKAYDNGLPVIGCFHGMVGGENKIAAQHYCTIRSSLQVPCCSEAACGCPSRAALRPWSRVHSVRRMTAICQQQLALQSPVVHLDLSLGDMQKKNELFTWSWKRDFLAPFPFVQFHCVPFHFVPFLRKIYNSRTLAKILNAHIHPK